MGSELFSASQKYRSKRRVDEKRRVRPPKVAKRRQNRVQAESHWLHRFVSTEGDRSLQSRDDHQASGGKLLPPLSANFPGLQRSTTAGRRRALLQAELHSGTIDLRTRFESVVAV